MAEFAILADSTADLSRELREKYNIDYALMGFSDGSREYKASLDWEEITPADFYGAMKNGTRFTTVQVPMTEFDAKFREYLEKGSDILYIGCSSALSGSVTSSYVMRDKLMAEYPGRSIYCVDSLHSGMGQGTMAIKAAEMRDEGKSVGEIYAWLDLNRHKFNLCATVAELAYLKRSGRIKASSAFFGDIFAVKPIIISDAQGQNVGIRKVKGRRTSLREIADYTAAHIENPAEQTICIAHAECEEDALTVRDYLKETLGDVQIELNVIGPIVGASVGPGTVIVYYYGALKSSHIEKN
ncbi:MAG: DegV family protein [Butyrivibrio sp.]|nr:DegV family protein [Butyrivibrio sp.]